MTRIAGICGISAAGARIAPGGGHDDDEQGSDGFSAGGGAGGVRRRQRHSDREDRDGLLEGHLLGSLQVLHAGHADGEQRRGHERGGVRDEDRRRLPERTCRRCRTPRTRGGRSSIRCRSTPASLRSAAPTCDTLTSIRSLSGIPECNSTFATPLVALGATCGQDFECIDSVCEKAPMAWEGVCVAGNATGATCADDNRCAPKLICDGRGTSMDASDDVCVTEQDNGGDLRRRLRLQEPQLRRGRHDRREDMPGADRPAVLLRRRLRGGRRSPQLRGAAADGPVRRRRVAADAPPGALAAGATRWSRSRRRGPRESRSARTSRRRTRWFLPAGRGS